jgi:ATP-dependent Zn protease
MLFCLFMFFFSRIFLGRWLSLDHRKQWEKLEGPSGSTLLFQSSTCQIDEDDDDVQLSNWESIINPEGINKKWNYQNFCLFWMEEKEIVQVKLFSVSRNSNLSVTSFPKKETRNINFLSNNFFFFIFLIFLIFFFCRRRSLQLNTKKKK